MANLEKDTINKVTYNFFLLSVFENLKTDSCFIPMTMQCYNHHFFKTLAAPFLLGLFFGFVAFEVDPILVLLTIVENISTSGLTFYLYLIIYRPNFADMVPWTCGIFEHKFRNFLKCSLNYYL